MPQPTQSKKSAFTAQLCAVWSMGGTALHLGRLLLTDPQLSLGGAYLHVLLLRLLLQVGWVVGLLGVPWGALVGVPSELQGLLLQVAGQALRVLLLLTPLQPMRLGPLHDLGVGVQGLGGALMLPLCKLLLQLAG